MIVFFLFNFKTIKKSKELRNSKYFLIYLNRSQTYIANICTQCRITGIHLMIHTLNNFILIHFHFRNRKVKTNFNANSIIILYCSLF